MPPREGARYDAYLVKTDISGAVLWERRFGGEDDGEAVSVAVTGAGSTFWRCNGGVLAMAERYRRNGPPDCEG